MTVQVSYYGLIAEHLNKSEESAEIEITSNDYDLRKYFEGKHPFLKEISYQIAVNQELTNIVNPDTHISEIALLPPFAGG